MRVLLKLSGEALAGGGDHGPLGMPIFERVAGEIGKARDQGIEIGIVTGGGNILRGEQLQSSPYFNRSIADKAGMLGTVINALILQMTLEGMGYETRVMSAIEMSDVAEKWIDRRAIRHLEKGRIVIFGAGTGMTHHSTDFAAAQRAINIEAQLLLKGTSVDGVYSADPKTNSDAERFETITFDEVLRRRLRIMDQTAFTHCRDNGIPIVVFNIREESNLLPAMMVDTGTLIHDPSRPSTEQWSDKVH